MTHGASYLILRPLGDGSEWGANKNYLKRLGAFYVGERKCWLLEALPSELQPKRANIHGRIELGRPPEDIAKGHLIAQIDRAAAWEFHD